jgi:hypothetical protein
MHNSFYQDADRSSRAEKLGISHLWVGSIIHEDLDMLVACFLPGRAKDLSAPLYIFYVTKATPSWQCKGIYLVGNQ